MVQGRLLILDDDATVGQVLLMAAQVSGFEARHCTEVESFFGELAAWAPSHVAVDLTLRDTTGVQVLERLAAAGCRARVLICSGAGAPDLEAALAATRTLGLDGAGVLPKPFALAALRRLLA